MKEIKILSLLKASLLSLAIVSTSYSAYNVIHVQQLIEDLNASYGQMYTSIRRFGSYYNNAPSTPLRKGVYVDNTVSTYVHSNHTETKDLAEGIQRLRKRLQVDAPGSIWTIAVFGNPNTYAFFDPLRSGYEKAFSQYGKNDVLENIVKREKLDNTYQEFYGCNIRMTDSYLEDGTQEHLRTIYFPIHNKQSLSALVAVDIKESYIDKHIERYNDKQHTRLTNTPKYSLYTQSAFFICSEKDPVHIGVNYLKVLEASIAPSLIMAFLYQFSIGLLRRRTRSIRKDEMTNFFRRDYYEPRLKKMTRFAMLIVDIDHFKEINDTHGHNKGDEIISECAKRILTQIRAEDITIRWGGDEFFILFNNMTHCQLGVKAETIRKAVAQESIAGLAITLSIGGVFVRDTTFAKAYKSADKALYESKRRGRNRSTMADQ
ncbi:GGDEF domain-containing protein [Enterovibrio norvegicus]|uniref:GGDEF domain-containing protein n=1 Tax=Enterovibrio norvegicus TaxID=188144 RepID=UPI000C85C066|nr:GGDEF domain-containing protein [Enterovibrio norvegicus]PMI31944.1 diguanylate cyclase [Enterovibrio norvegicus]TKF15074.1 GGDEF domain-containing protein [Enterovibrio norvegicus]